MAILYGSTPTIISLRLESEGAKRGPRALTGTQCKVLCLAIRLRTNTDRRGYIMSLSFLPSTVGFFLSHPGGKQPNRRNSPFSSLRSIGDATYCRRLYSCLPEVYWKVFGRTLGKIWRCLGTFSLKKIARSTRGASTAGIWSSQFPIIPPNRERIPLDLPGGEILDGGVHDPRGRKESFVESPSLPRNPSHRSKFRIN